MHLYISSLIISNVPSRLLLTFIIFPLVTFAQPFIASLFNIHSDDTAVSEARCNMTSSLVFLRWRFLFIPVVDSSNGELSNLGDPLNNWIPFDSSVLSILSLICFFFFSIIWLKKIKTQYLLYYVKQEYNTHGKYAIKFNI